MIIEFFGWLVLGVVLKIGKNCLKTMELVIKRLIYEIMNIKDFLYFFDFI